jgi:hypothetical protein
MSVDQNRTISVINEFSAVPAGRTRADGPNNGARFRDELLYPALQAGGTVMIELDGPEGYGSSFLEEAFGGLVRKGLPVADILNRIKFVSEIDPNLVGEIRGYVRDAAKERQ